MPGFCGSTYDIDISLTLKSGPPLDLSGYIVEIDVVPASGNSPITLTAGNAGVVINDPTSGVIHMHMTSAQTTALGAGEAAINVWNRQSDEDLLVIGAENFETIPGADALAENRDSPVPPVVTFS